jgi:hypothetical protein
MDALEDSWRIHATVGTLGQPVTRHVARTIRCGSHQPSALEGLARLGTGGDLMRDVDRGVGFGVGPVSAARLDVDDNAVGHGQRRLTGLLNPIGGGWLISTSATPWVPAAGRLDSPGSVLSAGPVNQPDGVVGEKRVSSDDRLRDPHSLAARVGVPT